MKKRVPDKFWFPWWPDKWIFGSVRIEFTPAERGIWVDMLSLASKDNGHIRANEDTPYPLAQLAGMLIIPEKELDAAIKKFIKNKKLTKLKPGTLYVTKWEKYQFSERHKRRVEDEIKKAMSAEKDMPSKKKDAIIYNSTLNNNKVKYSEQHSELAALMESKIKERLPRYKFTGKRYLEKWANEFRLMEEKKEATISEMKELIIWIYKDDFWYKNILSAEKFRKQFGTRWGDMRDDKKKRGVQTREEINAMQKKALEGK